MSEICCDLCKYWLPELKECGNTHIDVCMNKEHFIKVERNCDTCEREIYNEALEDFVNKCDEAKYIMFEQYTVDMRDIREIKKELTK